MKVESGTFARASTGNATYILNTPNFTPKLILFFVTGKTSGDTQNKVSIGYGHDSFDGFLQTFGDNTGGKSSSGRTKAMSHWARVGANISERIGFTLVNIGLEEFTLNYTAVDINYNIHFLAIGD